MLAGEFLAIVGVKLLLRVDGVIGWCCAQFDVPAAPLAIPA